MTIYVHELMILAVKYHIIICIDDDGDIMFIFKDNTVMCFNIHVLKKLSIIDIEQNIETRLRTNKEDIF